MTTSAGIFRPTVMIDIPANDVRLAVMAALLTVLACNAAFYFVMWVSMGFFSRGGLP